MSPDRAAGILARLTAAHHTLVTKLRDMPPGAAQHQIDDDHWSAAQIGCHVAQANEWIAGVLSGSIPGARPAPADFVERFTGTSIPEKVKTFSTLEPPDLCSRDAALERLRTSCQHLSKAIASLTPERGAGQVVDLPYGTLSLFELAEFSASHVTRHLTQLERSVVRA